MTFDDYKVVLYRNQPDGWVAEVPSIPGCYALMGTREEALRELEGVFQMIAVEYLDRGRPLPKDTTEIWSAGRLARGSRKRSGSFGALTASLWARGIGPVTTCMTVDNPVLVCAGLPGSTRSMEFPNADVARG